MRKLPIWAYAAAGGGAFVVGRLASSGASAGTSEPVAPLELAPPLNQGGLWDTFGAGDQQFGPGGVAGVLPRPGEIFEPGFYGPPGGTDDWYGSDPYTPPLAPPYNPPAYSGGSSGASFSEAASKYPAGSPQAAALSSPEAVYLPPIVTDSSGAVIGRNISEVAPGTEIAFTPNSARSWWDAWFANPYDLSKVAPEQLPGSLVLTPTELARAQAINNAGGLPPPPAGYTPTIYEAAGYRDVFEMYPNILNPGSVTYPQPNQPAPAAVAPAPAPAPAPRPVSAPPPAPAPTPPPTASQLAAIRQRAIAAGHNPTPQQVLDTYYRWN